MQNSYSDNLIKADKIHFAEAIFIEGVEVKFGGLHKRGSKLPAGGGCTGDCLGGGVVDWGVNEELGGSNF